MPHAKEAAGPATAAREAGPAAACPPTLQPTAAAVDIDHALKLSTELLTEEVVGVDEKKSKEMKKGKSEVGRNDERVAAWVGGRCCCRGEVPR